MPPRDHFRALGRTQVALTARLRSRSAAYDAAEEKANVKNVGLGGACVELPNSRAGTEFRLEQPVTLELMAPTLWDPLSIQGRVAWIRSEDERGSAQLGIRFVHEEASPLFALFQLINANAYDSA